MNSMEEPVRLTQYSHGAGCGCKIAPKALEEILHSDIAVAKNDKLIVGYSSKDDAAVYDLGNGSGLVSTTDFFTPVVDDAFDFGRVAAANAISDVYAMGGMPILALAVLGWPVNKLPAALAQRVLEGGRTICEEAGIPLAGGHSIDSREPVFGLAVNGIVQLSNLKKNNTAKKGDLIYITKSLGVGILSTAEKRGMLLAEHKGMALRQMIMLNSFGTKAAQLNGVNAMTDITGFGLTGHLLEMAEGSGLTAEIEYSKVPLLPGLDHYLKQMIYPDNTFRNWSSYSSKVEGTPGDSLFTLCDPQTNGGLMIAVNAGARKEFEGLMKENGLGEFAQPIGIFKDTANEKNLIIS
jgi:selenide, water dikinase